MLRQDHASAKKQRWGKSHLPGHIASARGHIISSDDQSLCMRIVHDSHQPAGEAPKGGTVVSGAWHLYTLLTAQVKLCT